MTTLKVQQKSAAFHGAHLQGVFYIVGFTWLACFFH